MIFLDSSALRELTGYARKSHQIAKLGHASAGMTRHYVRHRIGKLVPPTK